MKTPLIKAAAFAILALALAPASGFAAQTAKATPPAAAAPADAAKAIPMYVRADAIDVAGKTFTLKRKDGVEVKHRLTPSTEIHQGTAPARLQDIKVGDYVSGSRRKVSDTEYTVVKITKFGPKADAPAAKATPPAKTN